MGFPVNTEEQERLVGRVRRKAVEDNVGEKGDLMLVKKFPKTRPRFGKRSLQVRESYLLLLHIVHYRWAVGGCGAWWWWRGRTSRWEPGPRPGGSGSSRTLLSRVPGGYSITSHHIINTFNTK